MVQKRKRVPYNYSVLPRHSLSSISILTRINKQNNSDVAADHVQLVRATANSCNFILSRMQCKWWLEATIPTPNSTSTCFSVIYCTTPVNLLTINYKRIITKWRYCFRFAIFLFVAECRRLICYGLMLKYVKLVFPSFILGSTSTMSAKAASLLGLKLCTLYEKFRKYRLTNIGETDLRK